MRSLVTALVCGLALTTLASAQPFQPDSRTLLLDHLDESFTPDGKLMTRPAVIKSVGELSGGRPMAGLQFVPGKFGQALAFHGLTRLEYPAPGNLNLSAGSLEFWTALNFDTAEVKKEPGVLKNQFFATIFGPARSLVCIYSTLGHTCVGIWDRNYQLILYGSGAGEWKRDEWHHVELRWGRQLEFWLDGKEIFRKDWFGLFGPIDAHPDDLKLSFGSRLGQSEVHSEFKLDEIRVLGPGGDQLPDYPVMNVPRLNPPAIDGQITEAEWADAARTTGFVGLNDHALVEDQTVVYCGWDETALYVAAECLDPKNRPIVAQFRDRDSAVYMEDAFDIILQPGPEPYPFYQLVSSAAGTIFDCVVDPREKTTVDTLFNPDWTVATTRETGRWTLEARIPFAAFNRPAPQPGERWRVNFCRDADAAARLSSWSYTAGNFHRTENFGEIIFGGDDRGVQLGPLGDWAVGKLGARFTLAGPTITPVVTFQSHLIGGDAKPIVESSDRFADYRALDITAPTLVSGLYNLTFRAQVGDRELYYHRLPFRVMKPYDIRVENYPYEGKLWITANIAGLPEAQGVTARSRLLQGERVVGECQTDQFTRGLGPAAIDSDSLPPGQYVVKSDLIGADGKILASAEADFEQYARPAWWRSSAGLDHSVPYPWQPVRVDDEGIRVLGRTYRVEGGSLPTQIVNQGQEVLAGPITLQATADGQTLDLGRLRALDTDHPDDASVRQAQGACGPLQVQLTTTTEFDGLQRYDLTLTPKGTATLETLALEIPVKRACATFMLASNGRSGTALEVKDKPWQSPFLPQVWVGNDDLGLAWFAESDQWWRPRDDQMLQVVPEGDRVLLQCAMVRQPLKLDQPVTFTFGLMATPTKESHAGDPFYYRFGGLYGDQPLMEFCRYPAPGNLDLTEGTLEFWFAPTGNPGGGIRDLFHLQGEGGSLTCGYEQGRGAVHMTMLHGKQEYGMGAVGAPLEPGQFAHCALTWSDKTRLYVNGKCLITLDAGLPPELLSKPARAWIRFGCVTEWRGWTEMALDELRISRGLRYTGDSFTPPATAFEADAQTLVLDHLDDSFRPDGEDAETTAAVISGQSGELGGIPSIGCSFIPGRFGQALRIAVAPVMEQKELVDKYQFNASLQWWWFEDQAKTWGWPPPLMIEPPNQKLRDTVAQHTELGLRSFPYMAYMGIGAPNWISEQFGTEWRRLPLSTQPAEPPRGHYFLDVCGNARGFGDYLAAGTEWLLDDIGFQGCYTDGNGHVYPCQNTHHGCGYVDENGVLRATWPIFGSREYLKRMYKLIHARHRDGILVNHVSYDTFIPTQSFTDVYYTGEHEQYEDLVKNRVRWQGRQWGFWVTTLGSDSHGYEPLHTTYGLLHGVSVWPQGWLGRNDCTRKAANLWQTYDRFGYREAQWIPYYQAEAKLVRPAHERVKASLYLKQGAGALIIVGNLEPQVVETQVAVDLAAMGLKGTAHNALSERPLVLKDGQLSVRLRPHSMVLVWVE